MEPSEAPKPIPPRVTVYWLDIFVEADCWTNLSEAKGRMGRCETTGYLIEDAETHLTVALNVGVFHETQVDTWATIPRGCVTKVERLAATVL